MPVSRRQANVEIPRGPVARTLEHSPSWLLDLWVVATSLGCLGLAALGILGWRHIDAFAYFPGDPPAADILVELGLLVWAATILGLIASVLVRRRRHPPRSLRRAAVGALSISLLTSGPAILQVSRRQLGEWAELRALLEQTTLGTLKLSGRTGGRLTQDEVDAARAWYLEHPVHFTFRALRKPVQVRVMTPLPPYVGVDFGDGKNAVFDPTTMLCDYAD